MNRITKKTFLTLSILIVLLAISGCSSLIEEDPNDQQIPWATPADWEGQVPGMPGRSGF
jgi:uncharacterized protein YceK